ncbi:hypothetical protein RYH73_04305 [Olivibacter sp. CPCC 100613]|uniref:hypothetical protein n=1 Tax=Olivibacter sp. CPCC 100613 TaxID=3079931 RepID=UPI002FFA7950
MSNCKKLLIVFSFSIFLFFGEIAINIACGPEPDPYDYYISYFHNDIQGNAYAAFSFTDLSFLYSEDEPQTESQINAREWTDYLAKGVQASDVRSLMYQASEATDSLVLNWKHRKIDAAPDSLKRNTFFAALLHHKQAFDYYLFAKECEGQAAYTYDHWDPTPRDTMAMLRLAERALKHLKKVKRDDFLRLRYAYQAARMYHYAADYKKCIWVYDEYIQSNDTKSAVQGWALALKAGALRRIGEESRAAFLFSKVFEGNPERRVQAYKNYHYINVNKSLILPFANSNDERAIIWSIEGFNNTELNAYTLDTVYQLAPANALVGTLLIREINKLEGYLNNAPLSEDLYGYRNYLYGSDSLAQKARLYADSLLAFSLRLAADKKYKEPSLGTVAAAYISWMKGDNENASALLDQLETIRLSAKLRDQYQIIRLLIQVHEVKRSGNLESEGLLSSLKWLDEKRLAEYKNHADRENYGFYGEKDFRFTRTTRNIYQSLLAPRYLQLKDTAMAAVSMVKGDIYWAGKTGKDSLFQYSSYQTISFWQQQLRPEALLRIKAFKEHGSQEQLTNYLVQALNALQEDDFYELLGTSYLRTHEYSKALASFNKLSTRHQFWVASNWYNGDEEAALQADPFFTTVNDYPKTYTEKGVNKKEFAEQMVLCQEKIKSDPKNAAKYYFAMANGVYQTGTFGNSWYLISYTWSSADAYISGTNYYDEDYKHAKQASKWYEKARSLSKDLNFKAKCTFMLAKCEQKKYGYRSLTDYYSNRNYTGPDPLWLFSMKNKYFVEFAKYYKETAFYQQAVGECSYLSDFIKSK